jgi:hypothetical protein
MKEMDNKERQMKQRMGSRKEKKTNVTLILK